MEKGNEDKVINVKNVIMFGLQNLDENEESI